MSRERYEHEMVEEFLKDLPDPNKIPAEEVRVQFDNLNKLLLDAVRVGDTELANQLETYMLMLEETLQQKRIEESADPDKLMTYESEDMQNKTRMN
jgi:competence transcription factor ComK